MVQESDDHALSCEFQSAKAPVVTARETIASAFRLQAGGRAASDLLSVNELQEGVYAVERPGHPLA